MGSDRRFSGLTGRCGLPVPRSPLTASEEDSSGILLTPPTQGLNVPSGFAGVADEVLPVGQVEAEGPTWLAHPDSREGFALGRRYQDQWEVLSASINGERYLPAEVEQFLGGLLLEPVLSRDRKFLADLGSQSLKPPGAHRGADKNVPGHSKRSECEYTQQPVAKPFCPKQIQVARARRQGRPEPWHSRERAHNSGYE